MRAIPAAAWNALVGDESPFLEWAWLASLEEAGCVGRGSGWLPQPLALWDGDRLVGAVPLYVKGDSRGEFVFDWSWAEAAHRARIPYYPKLLVGVPFTPVDGARFLAAPGYEAAVRTIAVAALENACGEQGFSSVHVNFCRDPEMEALVAAGWLHRLGFQYRWRNDGFGTFDDYLQSLRSKRRNQVRREQRELADAGVSIAVHDGRALPDDVRRLLYPLYRSTVDDNPWGQRYLNPRFFDLLCERFADRLTVVVARQRGEVIAGTINVEKGDTLYGRYWGCLRPVRNVHFGVCYYAGIAHCIARGRTWFHPGAGGEHKQPRGFDAVRTHSVHFIQHPRLRAAVARYLADETPAVERAIAATNAESALRRGPASPVPAP